MKSHQIENIYPLSPMQQGMLFHSLYEPDSQAYSDQLSFRISGSLNLDAFMDSWKELSRRHAVLRTAFVCKNHPRPLQVVFREREIPVAVETLDSLSKTIQQQRIDAYTDQDKKRGFDLTHDPLMRVAVFCMGPGSHHIVWSHHHILADGWCMGILYRELMAIYESLCKGERPLMSVPRPFQEYIEWLNEQDVDESKAYWREYLSGYKQLALLPMSVPKSEVAGYRLKGLSFTLSEEVSASLKELAARQNMTPYTLFQVIWGILLSCYNRTDDVVFGAVVSGRPSELRGVEEMVGLFINTVPVRIRTSAEQSFSEVLKIVQEEALESEKHHYVPLVEIQADCSDMRTLFNHLLVFENYPLDQKFAEAGEENKAGLSVDYMDAYEQTNYDFDITVFPGEKIRIDFSYNENVYPGESLERVAAHFRTAVDSVLENPERSVGSIDILPEKERNQVLYEFNDTAAYYPSDKTVVDLLEEQVEKTPDNVAVVFEDTRLTYCELNEWANRIAHFLRGKYDIRPDDRVGLFLERSEQMIAGILGILKSGGAYVPIDPEYPRERIRHIISDSGCKAVLSETGVSERIPLDAETADINDIRYENASNPEYCASPHDLAYMIYTSGSTGVPKGVLTEHRNLYDYVMTFTNEFRVTSGDRFLQQTTVTFDASVEEIYPPLCTGAELFLLRDSRELDTLFADAVRHRITILSLSPPAVGYFNTRADELSSLRVLISGGDVLYPSHIDRLYKKTMLYNTYGPTEATVCGTYHRADSPRDPIPIGRPIANRRVYILDAKLNPSPVGVFGEICIAGAGTARGYLNRDNLTEEKFIPDPFKEGERLYRTGDLARWLPDGNIEFLGRNDDQVKIRGYRIELGEIENCLLSYEAVRETAVITKASGGSSEELAAYVVSRSESHELNIKSLREHLEKTLPAYMIPSYFVRMEKLPLTQSGKIDKKALPNPAGAGMDTGTEYIAPRDEAEKGLAKIWQDILSLEKVGIQDNFFDLGGHSLKATQVVSRIHKELGVEIALRKIFSQPTIEKLAEHIRTKDSSDEGMAAAFVQEKWVDLKKEALLNLPVPLSHLTSHISFEKIFLTGATGFIGTFLLKELLRRTPAKISLLVRAATTAEAEARLLKSSEVFGRAWSDEEKARVVPVLGDLSQPHLGLDETTWKRLESETDIIYHNGAYVHHILPYSQLKPANVGGTREILRLACAGKLKPVHFISTSSIFSALEGRTNIDESADIDEERHPESEGYTASKWVAEKLVMMAGHQGIPYNIYRLGAVTGHSETGACNPDDMFYRFVRTCIQTGCFPEGLPDAEMTPVDTVANAIVHLSMQENLSGKCFHLFNPESVPVESLFRAYPEKGTIRKVSLADWVKQVEKSLSEGSPLPIAPYVQMFKEDMSAPEKDEQGPVLINGEMTSDYLRKGGICYPRVTEKLLQTYFAFLQHNCSPFG